MDDEKINKKLIPKEYNKSDLIYNTNHSFYDYYRNSKKFDKLLPKSKTLILRNFLNEIDKFSDLISRMTTQGKKRVFDKVSVLYNNFLGKYFDEYYDLPIN